MPISPVSFSGAVPQRMAALPGVAVSLVLALTALVIGAGQAVLPTAVVAVVLGMMVGPWSSLKRLAPGMKLCTGPLLRSAVALLGLRLSLVDVAEVGLLCLAVLMAVMVVTVLACRALAARLGLSCADGLVIGAANAICGAAAAFAMAAALPERVQDRRILLLTVVLANAVSTLAMVLYPVLGTMLGFQPVQIGILIGASMQDMAQVIASSSLLPEEAAKAGITVKMMRVLLLLPVVLLFTQGPVEGKKAPSIPRFALFFIGFCVINTALMSVPALMPFYAPLRTVLLQLSGLLLLLALAAMGLGTTLRGVLACGWRPLVVFATGTVLILAGALALANAS